MIELPRGPCGIVRTDEDPCWHCSYLVAPFCVLRFLRQTVLVSSYAVLPSPATRRLYAFCCREKGITYPIHHALLIMRTHLMCPMSRCLCSKSTTLNRGFPVLRHSYQIPLLPFFFGLPASLASRQDSTPTKSPQETYEGQRAHTDPGPTEPPPGQASIPLWAGRWAAAGDRSARRADRGSLTP